MNQGSLLVVDDDRPLLEAMADYLRSLGHRTETATTCDEAVARMKEYPFDAVICDVNLPDRDGFELLDWAVKSVPDTQVILLTGFGTIDSAVEAIRLGAFDYLTKPIIDDEIRVVVQKAARQQALLFENQTLKQQLDLRFGLGNIVGHDYKMLKVFDLVDAVADSRTTILMTGESGTGKSLLARAIHHRSPRRDKPFIEVSCGALPETLLESELFGHVKGAFTGAVTDKPGRFLAADNGTIFLDEINSASPAMQVKLLRVLQERAFEPVGSADTRTVDARVMLASNVDLTQLVTEQKFRQDLYYRINVVNIRLPSLRERLGDIPLLAGHFLRAFVKETGRETAGFTDAAMAAMQRYQWPGNVRELENAIERAVVLCRRPQIDVDDLPETLQSSNGHHTAANGHRLEELDKPMPLELAMEGPERRILESALKRNNWNRQSTAAELNINRTTLYKKMRKYHLDVGEMN